MFSFFNILKTFMPTLIITYFGVLFLSLMTHESFGVCMIKIGIETLYKKKIINELFPLRLTNILGLLFFNKII